MIVKIITHLLGKYVKGHGAGFEHSRPSGYATGRSHSDGNTPPVFETQSAPAETRIRFHFRSKIRSYYLYCLRSVFLSDYYQTGVDHIAHFAHDPIEENRVKSARVFIVMPNVVRIVVIKYYCFETSLTHNTHDYAPLFNLYASRNLCIYSYVARSKNGDFSYYF